MCDQQSAWSVGTARRMAHTVFSLHRQVIANISKTKTTAAYRIELWRAMPPNVTSTSSYTPSQSDARHDTQQHADLGETGDMEAGLDWPGEVRGCGAPCVCGETEDPGWLAGKGLHVLNLHPAKHIHNCTYIRIHTHVHVVEQAIACVYVWCYHTLFVASPHES